MAESNHDWERDERSLSDCLKTWHGREGWTRERAASELRVPLKTYSGWVDGRPCQREATIRRLMTLIG